MTLIYARIANRVVADEYAAVSAKIDVLYGQQPELPADYETTGMARLRREAHARLPGNGLCTRPVELDCGMESACETCAYFRTCVDATTPSSTAKPNGPPCSTASFSASTTTANGAEHMTQIHLDHADVIGLGQMLSFVAEWLSGNQKPLLTESLMTFVGHTAATTSTSSAQTCSDSCSCLASATVKNHSRSPHHDQQDRPDTAPC